MLAVLCSEKYITRTSPVIFQTLLQTSSSSVDQLTTIVLLRDRQAFIPYSVPYFIGAASLRNQHIYFNIPSQKHGLREQVNVRAIEHQGYEACGVDEIFRTEHSLISLLFGQLPHSAETKLKK